MRVWVRSINFSIFFWNIMVPQQMEGSRSESPNVNGGLPLFGSQLVDKNSSTPYSDATQVGVCFFRKFPISTLFRCEKCDKVQCGRSVKAWFGLYALDYFFHSPQGKVFVILFPFHFKPWVARNEPLVETPNFTGFDFAGHLIWFTCQFKFVVF